MAASVGSQPPAPSPVKPRRAPGEAKRRVEAHLPTPVRPISLPKWGRSSPDLARGGEGHRSGSGAAVPLRCIAGVPWRGKQGYPDPRGTVAAPVPSQLTAGTCQGGALLHTEQGHGWHAARSLLRLHRCSQGQGQPRFGALLP